MARQIHKVSGYRQLLLLILVALAALAVFAAVTPWAFFMGGNFHPLGFWQGWGVMKSKTAGDYILYVRISPRSGRGDLIPAWDVKGTGDLCTPKSERFQLHLGGDMPRKFYINSLGQPINLWMSNWRVVLPIGQENRPSFKLSGHWTNSAIVADDRGSLSAAFLPDGTLRPHGSYPLPSQREDIPVTLREGTYSEWEAACRAPGH